MARKAQKWTPRVELTAQEERLIKLCKKRKLYPFFRRYRHRIFDDEVQAALLKTYSLVGRGDAPKPPAQVALLMLMQAAFGVPDHDVPTLTVVDQRWQMTLDCLGREEPLVSQGTVFNFRMRAIEHGLAAMLVDKTVKLARETKGYSAARLRAAFDSSPLTGAGQIEDTFNLIGRAAVQVVRTAAKRVGQTPQGVAQQAGIPLATASSIKAGLDLDWDKPGARKRGLQILLKQVRALHCWLQRELSAELQQPPLKDEWETVERLIAQDTEPDPDEGGRRIIEGTAKDRQISVSDPEMRHGRKSRNKRIDGYKRHVVRDLDVDGLICATKATPANRPDREAAAALFERVEAQGLEVDEAHFDRAYVSADAVETRQDAGMHVITKPHPVTNGARFSKTDFSFDFRRRTATCPAKVTIDFRLGTTVEFPAEACHDCIFNEHCTTARPGRGRTLSIHRREPFQHKLRILSRTKKGRAQRRERSKVEHSLARIAQTQGSRARYRGIDKNDFDLDRHAVINNCYVLNRLWSEPAAA